MPRVQPTTVVELESVEESPCCGAPLELSSPPDVYECRECTRQYDLSGGSDDPDGPTCAGTTGGGEPCTREVDTEGDYCWQHPPDGDD